MKASQLPTRVPVPFASGANPTYVRAMQIASQIGITDGQWSFTDGSPPLNFLPTGSGGVPPDGRDFNALMLAVTQWTQWQSAGGSTSFDPSFAAAVGGYPKGAIVASTTAGTLWLCTADNNTTNPDASNASGWIALGGGANPQGTIVGNGWWRDPVTGFTIEWGTVTVNSSAGYTNVTFPRALTALFSAIASDNAADSWSTSNATFNGIGKPTLTGFQAQCATWNGSSVTRNVTVVFGWHAFGLS